MLDRIKAVLRENDMCVLATCRDNRPHCSLMAYIVDSDCRTIYMVTREDTTKYTNVLENREVSLLVDTRCDAVRSGRSRVQALTVYGAFAPLETAEKREAARLKFLGRHPHLKSLVEHPKAAVMPIRIKAFLLLDGVHEAHFENVE